MKLRLLAVSLLLVRPAAALQDDPPAEWGKRERPAADQKIVKVEETVCPVCGTKSERVDVSGVQELEWDTDFKVLKATYNQYPYVLMTCPKCSYSTYSSQFHKPLTDDQKTAVQKALDAVRKAFPDYWSIPISFTLRTASLTHRALDTGDVTLFEIYLLGSYLARDSKEAAAEREMQRRALQSLTSAIENDEAYRRPKMMYMAGEICRRLELYKDAMEWFLKSHNGADEAFGKLITRQELITRDAAEGKGKEKEKEKDKSKGNKTGK